MLLSIDNTDKVDEISNNVQLNTGWILLYNVTIIVLAALIGHSARWVFI